MTALPASLGLLPTARLHGIGSETGTPFAVVVFGGVLTATLRVLLGLPVLHAISARVRRRTPA
ncbi:MAG TPA: efflux RND transporter permease subunit [Methylomirabilota bacterium]|nr:efflux RND transporter permease subunit [Methylomirabilota bacterium]